MERFFIRHWFSNEIWSCSMRILVTGVNGFIGTHIAEKFKKEGHIVVGTDRAAAEENCVAGFYALDILKGDLKDMLVTVQPDIIIHCAGLANVSFSLEQPLKDFQANTTIVYRLLEGMRQCGLTKSRFILLSSAAVYGQPERLPITEDDDLRPISPYALHKKMAEDICLYYVKNYTFDIRILRIFSAYGPGLKKQIFWDMYQKIVHTGKLELFGSGDESRDYIYIDDLVDAVYLISTDKEKADTVWNVANGVEVTIREVAGMFAKLENLSQDKVMFNGQSRSGDPINWCADISRLQELGYRQKISMEDGITTYLKWVQDMERKEEV